MKYFTIIITVLIFYSTIFATICLGAYLIDKGHPMAGGWALGVGLFCLTFGNYKSSDNDEPDMEEDTDGTTT
jgi:hypothetical protein